MIEMISLAINSIINFLTPASMAEIEMWDKAMLIRDVKIVMVLLSIICASLPAILVYFGVVFLSKSEGRKLADEDRELVPENRKLAAKCFGVAVFLVLLYCSLIAIPFQFLVLKAMDRDLNQQEVVETTKAR